MSIIQCFCPTMDFRSYLSDQCGATTPYSGCPTTWNGAGCPPNSQGYVTGVAANNCPGQQNRASNNFYLAANAPSGSYLITILADSLNTNPSQISFNIYHNVGGGQDDNLGRFYQGWTVQLSPGNNCYYLGGVSGAVGNFNVCFSVA